MLWLLAVIVVTPFTVAVVNRFLKILDADQENVAVIICSDEKINTAHFDAFNAFYAPRAYYEDFFILKECDYIIGPLSIFTMMANYLGINKIYQIIDPTKKFELEDFFESDELLRKRYVHLKSLSI